MVTAAAASLQEAIAAAVHHHIETGIYAGSRPAYGIGILLPSADEWIGYDDGDQYAALALSRETDWDEFVINFAGTRVVGAWSVVTPGGTVTADFHPDHTYVPSAGSAAKWSLSTLNVGQAAVHSGTVGVKREGFARV